MPTGIACAYNDSTRAVSRNDRAVFRHVWEMATTVDHISRSSDPYCSITAVNHNVRGCLLWPITVKDKGSSAQEHGIAVRRSSLKAPRCAPSDTCHSVQPPCMQQLLLTSTVTRLSDSALRPCPQCPSAVSVCPYHYAHCSRKRRNWKGKRV